MNKQYWMALTLTAGLITGSVNLWAAPKASHRPAPVPAATVPTLDAAWQQLPAYDLAQGVTPLVPITDLIRHTPAAGYPALEQKLLAALGDPAATDACRYFICWQLQIVGSAQSVPALGKLLSQEKFAHDARLALEAIADPAAGAALRQALAGAKDKQLIGLVMSLGARREAAAVGDLTGLLNGSAQDVAVAAAGALGQIGTPEAASALQAARAKVQDGPMQEVLTDKLVLCAGQLARGGAASAAAGIYHDLAGGTQPELVQVAGTRGLICTLATDEALKLLLTTLATAPSALHDAVLAGVRDRADEKLNIEVMGRIAEFKPVDQLGLLTILSASLGEKAHPAFVQLVKDSPDPAVRTAAMAGLVRGATAADVPILVDIAANRTGIEQDTARQTLARLPGAAIDTTLVAAAQAGSSAGRIVALQTLAARKAMDVAAPVAPLAADPDAKVAAAAVLALGDIGGCREFTTLVNMVATTPDAALRAVAEKAAGSIAGRIDEAALGTEIATAVGHTKDPASLTALLHVAGHVTKGDTLALIRQELQNPNADIQDAAVHALADWPNDTAAADLLALAQSAPKKAHQILALRGYIRLAGLPTVAAPTRLTMYRNALPLAARDDEKRQILSGLGDLATPGALELVRPFLKAEGLRKEAIQCVIAIAKGAEKRDNKAILGMLQEMTTGPDTPPDLKKQLDEAFKAVSGKGGKR